ncbi:MAG: hypothetical protein H7256_15160 [Bdellovibrio sp.]|nr:hypothetical protein [Bdellovibrio sp.]
MKYQKNIALLVIGVVCFFSFSCNRAADSTSTKISIQLPGAGTLATAKDTVTITSDTAGGLESSEWSTITPTSVAQFNCFMVMITGPEELLKRNSCGKKIAPGSDAFTPSLFFGPIAGGYYSGSSLEVEVASGAGRVIMLVGFVSDSAAACQQYDSPSFDKSRLSKPYLIGKSSPTNLSPTVGNDAVSVPISMALNSTAWFEECDGPAFNKGSGDGSVATKVRLRKDLFPTDIVLENSCNSFEVELHNNKGQGAALAADTVLGIKSAGLVIDSFSSYSSCAATLGGANTFKIAAGQQATQRWIKIPSASTPSLILSLNLASTTLLPEISSNQYLYRNSAASTKRLDLTGPSNVVSDHCYIYDIALRSVDQTYFVGDGSHVYLTAPNASVYNSADCSGSLATIVSGNYDIILNNTGANTKTISMRFDVQGSRYDSALVLSSAGDPLPAVLTTTVYNASSVGATISGLNIFEDRVLPKVVYKCYGPFRLALTNSYGIEIPTTGSQLINISSTVANNTFKTSCYGGTVSSLTIPAGSSSVNFYLNSATILLNSGSITFSPAGGVSIPSFNFLPYFN